MSNSLSGWDDTIAAMATPPGIGAIGVIRVSGSRAFEIVNDLFPSKNLFLQNSHTIHVGFLRSANEILDEVVLSIFKSPHSYTGEDIIEISCHGSQFIQQKILQKLIESGARTAKPGEFTQRAFLNAKLDLAQAEAVADLIASNTKASQKTALQNMRGGFSKELKEIREELLKFSALIELELDFSQEDVEFADRKKLFELLHDAFIKISALIDSFKLGNVIKNGVQVAIIGKPNAGKSTLLNVLLNEDRAIVSEIEGTTRDTIEEIININGMLFKLIDTAGIRESTKDEIENIGVEKSLAKMRSADVVLYLFDGKKINADELKAQQMQFEKQKIKYLLVGNKADLFVYDHTDQFSGVENIIFISAKENKNIDVLKNALYKASVDEALLQKDVIVTNARHIDALKKISLSLHEIKSEMENDLPGDLLALEIRRCLHFIGEITGDVNNEEKLDYIFSKFCIGK